MCFYILVRLFDFFVNMFELILNTVNYLLESQEKKIDDLNFNKVVRVLMVCYL